MTAKDYIDSKSIHVDRSFIFELEFGEYIPSDKAYKAVDIAKKEFAESIIKMINNYQKQNTKGNIAEYVKSYCEGYCKGIINFIQ